MLIFFVLLTQAFLVLHGVDHVLGMTDGRTQDDLG